MNNSNVKRNKILAPAAVLWRNFGSAHPDMAKFFVFFMLSNGITVLQMIIMPVLKAVFGMTSLVDTSFQVLPVGHNFDGSVYYVFNYSAGMIAAGGGGGLAYFLAVQIAMGIAQIINFFAQRNITFKSNSNILKSAFWYVIAYIIISLGAAALQGIYKAPIYNLLMNSWKMGSMGETAADFITMIINCAISFWVFFPIFKLIFKTETPSK